jgi:tetratricopeptide (TPR) repeat protein
MSPNMNATPFRALFSNAGPSSVNTGSLPGAPRTTIDLGFLAAACFLICALLGLAGCNGPTKAGKEARSAAHDRMNLISAQVHFDQAKQSFEAGQFEKAMREINRAIMRYPDSPEYHLLQGRIYLETHQLESALMCFSTAAEICDEQLEALAKIDAQGLAVSGDRSPQATRRGVATAKDRRHHESPATNHERFSGGGSPPWQCHEFAGLAVPPPRGSVALLQGHRPSALVRRSARLRLLPARL